MAKPPRPISLCTLTSSTHAIALHAKLYYSAFLRELSQRSGLLGEWLMPALMCLANDPEGHNFRRSKSVAAATSPPPSCPSTPTADSTESKDHFSELKDNVSETSSKHDDSGYDTDLSVPGSTDAGGVAAQDSQRSEDGELLVLMFST